MTELSRKKRVVVLGGYGVFGGKLAEALLRNEHLDVIVAGRSQKKLKTSVAGMEAPPPFWIGRHLISLLPFSPFAP